MSELYFIGGAPLSGKSEVAKSFLEVMIKSKKTTQYVATDGLRRILWKNIPDGQEPTLTKMHQDRRTETEEEWIQRTTQTPHYAVERQHKESEVVWRCGIQHYLAII